MYYVYKKMAFTLEVNDTIEIKIRPSILRELHCNSEL